MIQKKYLCYQNSCARGRESVKTRFFIIGILFFRLMPHFKMVKNMLRGRRRCTRRTRCSRGRQTSMTRQSSPCRAWGSIMFTLGCAGVQPGSNPLLNLSRSGGPRRLWGCSWTSRGPMQTLGSTLITRVTSYLCYFFQVLPRRWCEWKRYLNQVLIILIYIPSYMFYTWNILILTSTLPFSMVQVD